MKTFTVARLVISCFGSYGVRVPFGVERRRGWHYGPGMPTGLRRWTPAGRSAMREALKRLRDEAASGGASPALLARIESRLKRYGG